MMKKRLVLILALSLILALTACGGSNTPIQDFIDEEGPGTERAINDFLPFLGMGEGARFEMTGSDADKELTFSFHFGDFAGDELGYDMSTRANIALDGLRHQFTEMIEEMRDDLGLDRLRLTMEFFAPDGSFILGATIDA